MGRTPTLRGKLTLVTAGALAVALAVGAAVLVALLQAARISALDGVVTQRAAVVATLVATDRMPQTLDSQFGEVVQVLDAQGSVVATTSNASLTLPAVTPEVALHLVAASVDEAGGPSGAGVDGAAGIEDAVTVVRADSPYGGASRVAGVAVPSPDGARLVVAATPLRDVAETVRTLVVAFLLVVPVLVAGLAAGVWHVLGRALRPVEDLRVAADAVASSGGAGVLPVPESGELAALATTLNAMLTRLDEAAAASRAAAERERVAADGARRAAQRQRDFVADAAHELRSPIASLSAELEVAQQHPQAYPREELVADLAADVARMRVLVEDLLLLARVGVRPLASRELDLAEVARGAVRGVAGEVAVPVVGAGSARGDRDASDRVLRNLVANALRHATGGAGGASGVEVVVADGLVNVIDDGIGIPPGERERVFERFVRLEEARERDAGGSGLGLAIARELAREMGGDVVLRGRPDGESGLCAQLRLPSGGEGRSTPPQR
ncbi:sensor histidine kinase [Serinibacter salmoneus]|uniref:histidine kinase n=1 Tax=Serinibacter salmoneus TaxID=556530 RepID=A0A2A9CYQ9_9MICO|nr:HAMP domain-containing sensor histidine kinase [Serinibacter salmoneus]PFG18719.1 signal transduction histidine kinase [Serinibacter salmoneus]